MTKPIKLAFAVSPEEVRSLREQIGKLDNNRRYALQVELTFIPLEEPAKKQRRPRPSKRQQLIDKLRRHVEELDLAVRTSNSLDREGITSILQLVQKTENELLGIKGFGKAQLEDVKDNLASVDLSLGTKLAPGIIRAVHRRWREDQNS